MRHAWLAAWALASVAGGAIHGPWAIAGVLAGLAAAWSVRGLGGGIRSMAIASILPPLASSGAWAMVPLAAFGLVVAWQQTGQAWVFAAGVAGLLLPGPAGPIIAALAGAALLAVGPWPRALLGIPVAMAGLVAGGAATIPLAILGVAVVGRWVAGHAANATMAWRCVQVGLVVLPMPAAVGYALASLDKGPEHVMAVFGLAAGAAALGGLFLGAHLGLGALLRSASPSAVWLAWTWAIPVAATGLVAHVGIQQAALAAPSLAALLAVPAALGVAWLLAVLRPSPRGTRSAPEIFTF